MEKEGLKRSLELLESKGVAVDYIVTDRHPQIQKFLRDRNVKHFYDVWHLAKGNTCLWIQDIIMQDNVNPMSHNVYPMSHGLAAWLLYPFFPEVRWVC